MGRAVAGEVDESSTLLKIAAEESGTPAGKRALIRLLGICTIQIASLVPIAAPGCLGISAETQHLLERVATRYGDEADNLLQRLARVVDDTRFGRSDRTRLDVLERLIQGLEHTPFNLADDALEGAAIIILDSCAMMKPHYQRDCELGQAMGCVQLGRMFFDGRGVPRDWPEATRLFELACDDDEPLGCYHLSHMHKYGRGLQVNEQRADELLQKACDLGLEPACDPAYLGRLTR